MGDTAAEALANLEDVAASWIESVRARGQNVPEPFEENEYSGKLVLRLAKSVHQKAAAASRRDGVSLNTFISNCVAEHLGMKKMHPMQHVTNNLSQQYNLVFLGQQMTYVTSGPTIKASTTETVVSSPLRMNNTQNPWKAKDA